MDELLKISKRLTKEFINGHLTEWFGQDVEYTKHEMGGGARKGDSYLSDIYRITLYCRPTVPGANDSLSVKLLIKALPKNAGTRKTFRTDDFFKNEIKFYLHVLPELLKFQAEKSINDPFDNYPKVFGAVTDGENDFIAMEDLAEIGFKPAVRQKGIDFIQCKITLECFAKFHAISFAMKDQQPEKFEELKTHTFETYYHQKYWEWYKTMWRSLCECAIDAVEKEYPNTIYEEKAKQFATDETFIKLCNATTENGPTAVFSHGDAWVPNLLYKYNESNTAVDAKMFDFQMLRCASPVLDMVMFIYSSTTQDMRQLHYDELLKKYHSTLMKNIKELGTDPEKVYPWSLFMQEVKKYSYFGIAVGMEATPVIILDPEDAYDINSVEGSDAIDVSNILVVKPIKKQAGRLRLARIFVDTVDNGYL